MTRDQKIQALMSCTDIQDRALRRLFLNQKSDQQLDSLIGDAMKDMENERLEKINS